MNAPTIMPLGDLAEFINGDRGKNYPSKSDFVDQGIPFINAGHLLNGEVDFAHMNYIGEDGFRRLGSGKTKPGDILYCLRGSLGKTAIVRHQGDAAIASSLVIIRPSEECWGRYLYRYLTSPIGEAEIERFDNGSSQPNLSATSVKKYQVPLPPLAEQKRIAGILDAADALRAKRRESIAQLDTLLQSTFLDMFGDPALNSKGLPTATLGELGDWHSGGTPPRKRKEYFTGTIPWFSSGELEQMYVSESAERITQTALTETSAKAVPAGALMLGMYDTAALKAALAGVDCSCNQAIAHSLLRPEACNSVFVYFAITIGREHFRRLQRGVRQKNLNLSMVKQIRIPLPPLDLQHRFAAIVEYAGTQQAHQQAHMAELDTLVGSLQSRAFRGEL